MRSIFTSSLILLLSAACGSGRTAALSLSARSTSALATAGATPAAGIELNRVRLVLSKLELEPTASPTVPASEDREAGEVEVAAGPFLLDLTGAALNGGVEHVLDAAVPAGTYKELKIEVRAVSLSDSKIPAMADLVAKGASVLLEGTIDGQPFTFASSLRAAQKKEGSFTISADGASTSNITLQLDPAGWFAGAGALRLDPRLDSARAQIEANLVKSIDLFQDDNRSGHENHHGHGNDIGADGGHGVDADAGHDADADAGASDAGCSTYYGCGGDSGGAGGHAGADAGQPDAGHADADGGHHG